MLRRYHLSISGPNDPTHRMTIATGVDPDLIASDRKACFDLFGPGCGLTLETLQGNDHDPSAWMTFVKETVDCLREACCLDPAEAASQVHRLNETRLRYFLNADVDDYEVREMEMGIRETLRITGLLDEKPNREPKGFGK